MLDKNLDKNEIYIYFGGMGIQEKKKKN